ncbi:MAG TPA: hypothetical protein VF575_00905 [Candidatus Saccharimonadales bacterium]|jgi:hypothetical protein
MTQLKQGMDWLFKDLHGRNGKYIIVQAPNVPQVIFVIFIILAVIVYPGFLQTLFAFIGYAALAYWGYLEITSGLSRFRKLLGYLAVLAVIGALLLGLGF